jgi:YVTN family beta-propeller protein
MSDFKTDPRAAESKTVFSLALSLGTALLIMICISCGQTYRPVATPQSPNPPNPSFSHIAVVLSSNGNNNPGAATTIDVSGDTPVSQSNTGADPAFVALMLNGTRVYVADRGDNTILTFLPNTANSVVTTSLPAGSVPVFVGGTQSSATVYSANSGNNTVSAINSDTNIVTNTIPVGTNPVALAELPNASRVYVANAGTGGAGGSVTSFNTIDFSVNPPLAGAAWISPIWVAARTDNQRVFVLDQGAGTVSEINTFGVTDVLIGSVPVGVGADYMVYDSTLNRLYVTNPITGMAFVLDASDSTGMISQLAAIPVSGALSIAALPDSSRFYVAQATVSGAKVASSVTVISASNFVVEKTITLQTVAQVCPSFVNTPFALSIAASADSTRVYVGNCDAENTAIISTVANNSPGSESPEDTLVKTLDAPLSANSPGNGGTPPPQNPVFVVTGP